MGNASRGWCWRGVLSALEEHLSASNQPVRLRRGIAHSMGRCRGLDEDGKDALAGGRRGADKDAGVEPASDEDRFGLGRGSPQLHDHNDGRRGSNGHHGVHDDAELAVIGVRLVRVQVGDLGDGEKSQQNKAQSSNQRYPAGAGAATSAKNCARSSQSMVPSASSILQESCFL